MEKNLNIRISASLLKNYKAFCKKHGYSLSERIRGFIKSEMQPKLLANSVV